MATVQVLLPSLKITPRFFFFGNFRVLGKLHLHQTLSEIPSKPGGQVRNLPLSTHPTDGKETHLSTLGWDMLVPREGSTYYLNVFFLASLLRLLLQLLLITSKRSVQKKHREILVFSMTVFRQISPAFWLIAKGHG